MARRHATGRSAPRRPSARELGPLLVLLVALLSMAGCSGGREPDRRAAPPPGADPSATASSSATASPPAPSTAPPSVTGTPSPAPTGAAGPATPQPTVPARPVRRLPPVPLVGPDGAARPAEVGALRVDVLEIAPAVSAGQGPGEVQGLDAVAVTVRWTNAGSSAVRLTDVVVDMSYGAAVPASPVSGPPSRPVTGSVRPGGTATGVYVFAVPTDQRRRVELSVSSGAALPRAVFAGPVA